MTTLTNAMRREETVAELRRLADDFKSWKAARDTADPTGQHRTQLKAVELLTTGAITDLEQRIGALSTTMSVRAFYEECRSFDKRVIWVRRIWQFFQEKFDQRDNPQLGPLLRAADEAIWSCYRQVFERAEAQQALATTNAPTVSIRQGPFPLAYVEPLWTPAAYPTALVPNELKDPAVTPELIRTHLNSLPVPVVRLPPVCVAAPWWLVFVGHEVGHHIQYDLLDDEALVPLFQELIEKTVKKQGATPEEAKVWGNWSREIFADIFSVLLMGPAAVTALEHLLLAGDHDMLLRREEGAYPAAVVRLELLAQTAVACGLDGVAALRHITPADLAAGNSDVKQDMTYVKSIVEATLGPIPGLPDSLSSLKRPLLELVVFDPEAFTDGGIVTRWGQTLRGMDEMATQNDIRTAREVTSGAVQAWRAIGEEQLEQLAAVSETASKAVSEGIMVAAATQRQSLATEARKKIADSREKGMRSQPPRQAMPAEPGSELSRLLARLDPETIG